MSIYKGNKLVAGGSIDTHFVRNPAWDQAVAVSVASILTGYKAPADGMIVGILFTNGNTSTGTSVVVNGVEVARNKSKDSDRILNVQCTVNKDDVIAIASDASSTDSITSTIRFVPFEYSAVSEVEAVSPELIRNLHDPDWSKIQYYTAAQLNAGITIPARGIFICTVHTGSPQKSLSNLKINGKTVDWSYWNVEDGRFDLTKFCFSGPVCKGDIVTVTFNVYTGHDDDYTNFPIAFVPYKAQ